MRVGFDLEGFVRDALAVDADVALLRERLEAKGFAFEVCEDPGSATGASSHWRWREHAHFVEGFRKTSPFAAPSSACATMH